MKSLSGDSKTFRFRSGTCLMAPNDRTLVIVREVGEPLVIKGGKMRITADGIDG